MTDPDFTQRRRTRILDATASTSDRPDEDVLEPDVQQSTHELSNEPDASDEESVNDRDRAVPRGQRVMLREIEDEDRGRAENLMADTPPDADHAPESLDLAVAWANQTQGRTGALQRSARYTEGVVAADAAEITPLEAERMGLTRSQQLSHEPVHQTNQPTPEIGR